MNFSKEAQVKRTSKKKTRIPKASTRGKIITQIDAIISKRVRERDQYICIHCGSQKLGGQTNSHYWNRDYMGTRFDMENCDTACWACHHYHLEQKKQGWYKDFKRKQLGEERYEALKIRALAESKYSTVDLKLMLELYEKGIL